MDGRDAGKGHGRSVAARPKSVRAFLFKCLGYWAASLWIVSRFSWIENACINATLLTLQAFYALFHVPVERGTTSIIVGGKSVNIVADCSPHLAILILAGVILAFPATWRQRLVGLFLGAIAIHVFNTIRIVSLIWILGWQSSWFEFVHVYLWQTGTILIIFGVFVLWIRTLEPKPAPA